MRSSTIFSAIALVGAVAASAQPDAEPESSTTITVRVTSTITTTSYVATQTVTGTPSADATQTGSPSVLTLYTTPASTLKTMQYGPGATGAAAHNATAGYSNSASPLLRSREVVLAGALSALTMVLAIL